MNSVDITDFFELGEELSTLSFKNFNFQVFSLNLVIILIVFIIFYDLKPKDIIKDRKYIVLLALMVLAEIVLEFFVGNIPAIIPIITFFLVNILFLLKDKELFNMFNTKNNSNSDLSKDVLDKIKKIGKKHANELNILDVLYIYDYITDYQRRRVMQDLIYENIDNMAEYLTERPAVTDEELKEARAILNIITINDKFITKEEAMLYLVKLNNEKDDVNLHPLKNINPSHKEKDGVDND